MSDTTPPMATPPNGSAFRAPSSPLAIVGIGCLFPKAVGPGYFWANVKNGVDCIGDVPATHWSPDDYFDADPKKPDMTYARRGGFLDAVDFNPLEFGIAPRDIEATDTTQLLGLVAAKQALTDAGVVLRNAERGTQNAEQTTDGGEGSHSTAVDRNRVSVILGVTGTLELVIPLGARLGHPKWKRAMKEAGIPDDAIEDAAGRIAESYVPWQENSFPGLLGNVVAGRIANKLDLGGTNCVVDAACASSLSAVHLAALELQTGKADVVVTGGADTFNDIFMFMCFSKTPALSPTGDAKPFDANGDGTILGEGLGMVVLKRLADAEHNGDTIYAVIRGIGSSSDGKGNAIYAPSAAGQKKCLLNAYRNAGVRPETIELVEAHGTGTKVGDTVEITALTEVYGDATNGEHVPTGGAPKPRPWCAIGSVKSQLGHTKAAAGAASLIKATLALYNKVLPPTLKVTQPVEPLRSPDSPFYVNTRMRPWLPREEHPRRAALSAFGFGGSNFHAVLEEHRPEKQLPDWDGTVEVVALGADTPQELLAALEQFPTGTWNDFARAAETARTTFRAEAPCRLAFAAHRTLTELPRLIASAAARLRSEPNANAWHTLEGAHYGRGPATGSLAVLFPGQGSQYVGMLRDLTCLFPELLDTIAIANTTVAAQSPANTDSRRLSDRIFPPSSFDPERKQAADADLRDTRNAQPALGAVSLGLWSVLHDRFGLTAAAFAGHSYGELVALTAAGRLSPTDLFALSQLRGELMARQREEDAGSMLAVLAPLPEIEAVLHREGLNLTVANHNAPKQTVLSGATPEVERAETTFTAAGLKVARLPVAAAFHSEYVADAATPFRAALETIPMSGAQAPVYANTTAAEYPSDPTAARDLLANQLAKPVAFVEEIRAIAAAGVRTFVEIGPGSVLTRLTEAILGDAGITDANIFAVDESGGKRPGVLDLAHAIARLAVVGIPVRLPAWEAQSRCRPPVPSERPGLTVPICGANYVTPRAKKPPRPALPVNGKHEPLTTRARPTFASSRFTLTPPPRGKQPALGAPQVLPMSDSTTPSDPGAISQALLMTQQSLAALQRMQEQTAQLHRQFLESQEAAQRTLQTLVDQQQALLLSGLGAGIALPATPVPPPMSIPQPQPAPVPAPPPPVYSAPRPVAPVAAVSPPAPAPQPTSTSTNGPKRTPAPASDRVAKTLLEVVSEKTGYPVSSLDLKLSLDADLGVDSIKRVEILSALQEKLPDSPQVKPEHLGSLHTLQDVANFLGQETGTSAKLEADDELTRTMPVTREQLLLLAQSNTPTSAKAAAGSADVARVLLEVVSEKTGYPVSSLDLKLSLDADLGVDSIKRVEILSALQEKLPDSPQVKPEHLGSLHTLQDVANFLGQGAGPLDAPPSTQIASVTSATGQTASELATPKTKPVAEIPAPTDSMMIAAGRTPSRGKATTDSGPATEVLPRLGTARAATPTRNVSETLRQPVAPLGPDRIDRSILQTVDLDPASPRTRVPLPAGAEIWVVSDADPLTEGVVEYLAQHGYNSRIMDWASPGTNKPAGALAGLVLIAPIAPGPDSGLCRKAFEWVQQLGAKLRQSGRQGAAVLATVARFDGAFGLNNLTGEADPTAGGLAGIVKTARHEWPELSCKAIDLDAAFTDLDAAAAALADEILTLGPLEVGVGAKHRCTLELARMIRRASSQTIGLGAKDVILVTGGARGVTAEAAIALAETFGSTLILTGRTPTPGPEPEWLVGLTTEADIKKAIAAKLGPDAGPRQIGDMYQKAAAQREVRQTIRRIEESGARVAYLPVDVSDGKAVANLLHQVRVKFGPVTGLVHGAGVLADRRLEDLTLPDFDRVYSTKVDGLRNVLDLLANESLKALVLFSSTTARFGRVGQLAYAVANEVLNKTAQVEARRRPTCRVVAINWGPWEGGMVTPGLRKQFESESIGLIPLHDGAMFLMNELNAAGKSVEVIALGKFRPGGSGSQVIPSIIGATTPPPGGVNPGSGTIAVPSGSGPILSPPNPGVAIDMTMAFERTLDVESHPILRSHVMDGRAVLPMALHLEFLAHAALHGNPGLVFHGFNDLRVTQGVKLDAGDSTVLRAFAGKAVRQDKLFVVPVELRGKRNDGREMIQSKAEIVLTASLPAAPTADRPPAVGPTPITPDQAYSEILFHGPDLRAIDRIDGVAELAFVGSSVPAPPPAEWLAYPLRSGWVADPMVLDASFQMMILWSVAQHGMESLPNYVGRYRQFRRTFPTAPVNVIIRVTRDDGRFARADIDYLDADGQVIAQMQDYECLMEKNLHQAFRNNQFPSQ